MVSQQNLYERIVWLWGFSPVHAKDVLWGSEFDELKLTDEQHIELYQLTVDWVSFALPQSSELSLETRSDRMESQREVSLLAWKYKTQRDRRFRQTVKRIVDSLTDAQQQRWQSMIGEPSSPLAEAHFDISQD